MAERLVRRTARTLETGDPTHMEIWLSRTTIRTFQGALALVADSLIEEPPATRGELQPFVATEQGVAALGSAVTLCASVSTGVASVADLTGFEATLDRIFGSPRELDRSPARLEEARVLDDPLVRLDAFGAAHPARRLLLWRMLYVNRRVL